MTDNNNSKEKNILQLIVEWSKSKFQASTGWERLVYGAILALTSLIVLFFFSSCSLVDNFADTSCKWNETDQQIEIVIKPRLNRVTYRK